MRSELIVITFDREAEASRVREALDAMRRSQTLALESAVSVTRDKAGKVRLHQVWELPDAGKEQDRHLLSNLANVIFGHASEALVRKLAKAGLEERFLEQVAAALGQDASALLFLVRPDSVGDADELLNALTLFKGKIHRTTLLPQAEAILLEGGSTQ